MTAAERHPSQPCDHDWRINPTLTLTSFPPQHQQVCTRCKSTRNVVSELPLIDPRDPSTWPKATDANPPSPRVLALPEHVFWPVNGHRDDDECTHREDGTDATYCGMPKAWHERGERVPCDRCDTGLALFMVRCYLGCWHAQCLGCAEQTEREAAAENSGEPS